MSGPQLANMDLTLNSLHWLQILGFDADLQDFRWKNMASIYSYKNMSHLRSLNEWRLVPSLCFQNLLRLYSPLVEWAAKLSPNFWDHHRFSTSTESLHNLQLISNAFHFCFCLQSELVLLALSECRTLVMMEMHLSGVILELDDSVLFRFHYLESSGKNQNKKKCLCPTEESHIFSMNYYF